MGRGLTNELEWRRVRRDHNQEMIMAIEIATRPDVLIIMDDGREARLEWIDWGDDGPFCDHHRKTMDESRVRRTLLSLIDRFGVQTGACVTDCLMQRNADPGRLWLGMVTPSGTQPPLRPAWLFFFLEAGTDFPPRISLDFLKCLGSWLDIPWPDEP